MKVPVIVEAEAAADTKEKRMVNGRKCKGKWDYVYYQRARKRQLSPAHTLSYFIFTEEKKEPDICVAVVVAVSNMVVAEEIDRSSCSVKY